MVIQDRETGRGAFPDRESPSGPQCEVGADGGETHHIIGVVCKL